MNTDPKEHFSEEQIAVIGDIFTSKMNGMIIKLVGTNLIIIVGALLYLANLGSDVRYNRIATEENAKAIAALTAQDTNTRVTLSAIQTDMSSVKATLLRMESYLK